METDSGVNSNKPVWAIAHERYDPAVHAITTEMVSQIRDVKLRSYTESVKTRFLAAEAIIEMIKLARADIFAVATEADDGPPAELSDAQKDEAVERADTARTLEETVYDGLGYANSLNFNQLGGELKELAAEVTEHMPGPYEAFSQAYDAGLIDSDTRRLGEGIIRYLIVKEGGLENRLPVPAKRNGI